MPINDKIKKLIGGLFGIGQQEGKRPRVGSTVEASPLPVDGDTPITAQRPRIVPGQPVNQDVGIQTIGGTEQIQGNTIAPPPPNPVQQGAVTNDPAQFQRIEPTPGTSELGTTMAQKPQSFMSMGDGSMPGSRQYMFALGRGEQPEADAPVADTATTATPNTLAAKPKTYTQSEIERRLNKELYKGGKDADKDHNWWDVVKSAALGFREGGLMGAVFGGVEGAFDPNADERMGNKWALGQLQRNRNQEMIGEDREAEQERRALDIANIQSQIDTRALEAERRLEQGDKRIEQGNRRLELQEKTQGWKEADRVEYFRLEREKLAAKEANDDRAYDLAVRRQVEIERNNKTNNELRDRQVTVQERRAQEAVERASRGNSGGSRGSGSRGGSTGMTPAKMQGWMKVAKAIDDDYKNGVISLAEHEKLTKAMEANIQSGK